MKLSELKALKAAATPGPWKFTRSPVYPAKTALESADGETMVAMFHWGKHRPEGTTADLARAEADASLTIAAPDAVDLACKLADALAALFGEWEAERFAWRENRPGVLSFAEPQEHTGHSLFIAARALLTEIGYYEEAGDES